MNKAYRVVWNESTNTWMAVSEIATGRRKSSKIKAVIAGAMAAALLGVVTYPVEAFIAQGGGSAGTDGGISNNTAINGGQATGSIAAVAIGPDATASNDNTVAMGAGATASGSGALSFGQFSTASGYQSLAIGPSSIAEGRGATAIGMGAGGLADNTTAIGWGSSASALKGVAIGSFSMARGESSLSIGSGTVVDGANGVAIGTDGQATKTNAVSVGISGYADQANSVALGAYSVADRAGMNGEAELFSKTTMASTMGAVSVGKVGGERQVINVAGGTKDTDAVNVRQLKTVETDITTIIGDTTINVDGSITGPTINVAGGSYTTITSAISAIDGSVTNIYNKGTKYFHASSALADSQALGLNSIAVGPAAVANAENAIAIGTSAQAMTKDSVALGAGSKTADAVGTTTTTINGKVYTFAGVSPTSVVSVGDAGKERQLTNVAAGRVTAASTDAINGSQLFATNTAVDSLGAQVTTIEGNITNISNVLADAVLYDTSAHDTVTLTGGTAGTRIRNVAAGLDDTDAVNVSQLQGLGDIIGDTTINGDTIYGPTINVAGGSYTTITTAISAIDGSVTNIYNKGTKYFHANSSLDDSQANGADSVAIGGNAQANADNSVALGSNSVADRENTVSVGSVGNERQIVNVAAGTEDTDAVNVSQLKGLGDIIGDTTINGDTIYGPTFNIDGSQYTTISGAISAIDSSVTNIYSKGVKYFHANSSLDDSQAIGLDSVAIGPMAKSMAQDSVAIGNNARSNSQNSVALGANSVAGDAVSVSGTNINGTDYSFAGSTATGTVSVGDKGAERQITNVAAGQITADSTDAVNGSQLYATNQAVSQLGDRVTSIENNISNIQGDITNIYNELGNSLVKQDANTRDITIGGATDGKLINMGGTEGDRRITGVADGVNDNDAVNVSQLKAVEGQVTNIYNKGTKYFQANSTLDAAQANGTDSVAIGGNAIANANNSVALGSNSVADRANTVSVGAAGAERQVTNVADGTADTDAVNVRQLKAAVGDITNINNRIDDVEKSTRRGIAAAAALQIVTPYLPGRTVVNAGVAGYRGQAAIGVGVSRWNDKGTINFNAGVSTATGGKDTIIRAGVGFVLGD